VLLDPAAEVSGLGVAHDLTRVADRLRDLQEREGYSTPRVSAWLTGLKETIRELPAFVQVSAEIGVKEVYLQRLVYFDRDVVGKARPDQALFEQMTQEEAHYLEEAEHLARSLGMTFSASGAASEPGISLKNAEGSSPWSLCRRPWTLMYITANGRASTANADDSRRRSVVVSAIIPCLNEESTIAAVVTDVLSQAVDEVIVVDGGSADRTAERALSVGAHTVVEPRRGYGRAIQSGIDAVRADAEILLFLDGDGSDRPEMISALLAPLIAGRAAFVHGTRTRGQREPGSLSAQQLIAGHVAGLLLRLVYGVRFTDMSPFRAIRRDVLSELGMREETYGWNLEMLMRVAAARLPALELPVGQRRRAGGVSKVSGNALAGLMAAWSIATTFIRLALTLGQESPSHPPK
jgi:Glycosyl transferase family 2